MIIIDTETTGTQPWKHQIIQIAAYDVDTRDEFHRKLFFDESNADVDALKINRYNVETWRNEAVTQEEGRESFLNFVRHHAPTEMTSKAGKPYMVAKACAYNARFDKDFIARWMWDNVAKKRAFCPLHPLWFDPLQICLALFPNLPDHKLSTVCKHLGIDGTGAHDAMTDVLMVANLMYRIEPAMIVARDWCAANLAAVTPVPVHAPDPQKIETENIDNEIPF